MMNKGQTGMTGEIIYFINKQKTDTVMQVT